MAKQHKGQSVRQPRVQVCLPPEAYKAASRLAQCEACTMSSLGRRGFLMVLEKEGIYQQQKPTLEG